MVKQKEKEICIYKKNQKGEEKKCRKNKWRIKMNGISEMEITEMKKLWKVRRRRLEKSGRNITTEAEGS